MWWWYDRRVPRSEIERAQGRFPDVARSPADLGVALPQRLRGPTRFSRPEVLGAQEIVGGAGESVPVGRVGAGPIAQAPGGGGRRGPLGIIIGPVVSAALGAGLRAAGVPGIIAGIINTILGPAIRNAVRGTGERGPTLTDADVDELSASMAETRGPSAGPFAEPQAVPSPVDADAALPPGLNTEELDPYGDEQAPVRDTPGPSFPDFGEWSPF